MYSPNPAMADEQEGAIGLEMRKISKEMCMNEIDNYKQKLDVIIR